MGGDTDFDLFIGNGGDGDFNGTLVTKIIYFSYSYVLKILYVSCPAPFDQDQCGNYKYTLLNLYK